jgi:hypothetical protein
VSPGASSPDALWRPLGFFTLMIGFGLRLDTPFQMLASALIVAGALAGGLGLWMLRRRNRFRPAGEQGIMPPRPSEATGGQPCAPRSA